MHINQEASMKLTIKLLKRTYVANNHCDMLHLSFPKYYANIAHLNI